MPDTLHGLPFWTLAFDKHARATDPGAIDRLVAGARDGRLTDLFIFSHGWNNDATVAHALYDGFFGQVAALLGAPTALRRTDARVGVAGVIWPSILWPDDAPSPDAVAAAGATDGGAVALDVGAEPAPAVPVAPAAINAELKKAYEDPAQQQLIDDLTALLETQPQSPAALREFQAKLDRLLAADGSGNAPEPPTRGDALDAEGAIGALDDEKWRGLLEELGDAVQEREGTGDGGAVAFNPFKKLWNGAKDALRVATYWQMKQRGGKVGREGLAPVLARLATEAPEVRLHLLGHSFGARLVSFALAGLPDALTGDRSPVKSLFLLQGAFSHYAFADALPHDRSRSGALRGMAARVDGPLLCTHTRKDLAVGLAYPAASFVSRDDAAAADERSSRWGAMGHDGAQAVNAAAAALGTPGTAYPFQTGQWLNLDANKVIVRGGPPAGSHGDIVYPHTAWAALAAAGIA